MSLNTSLSKADYDAGYEAHQEERNEMRLAMEYDLYDYGQDVDFYPEYEYDEQYDQICDNCDDTVLTIDTPIYCMSKEDDQTNNYQEMTICSECLYSENWTGWIVDGVDDPPVWGGSDQ